MPFLLNQREGLVPLSSEQPATPPSEARRPRVLIVDDDEGPRLTWKFGLQDECEPDVASSVAEAIALVKQNVYAVILLDIRMPGEDGLAGLKAIRALDPLVSVIMATSYTELAPAQQAIELGASGYMTKPAKIADLRAKVRQEAEKCRHRRAKERLYQSLQGTVTDLQRRIDERSADALPASEAAMAFVHDLSQPLLATIGHATILIEDLQQIEPSNLAERRSSLLDSGRNLSQAANLCIALSQNWRALAKDRPAPVRVNLAVTLTDLHQGIFFGSPKVRLHFSGDLTVRGAPVEFTRIFQNLIHNALEAGATEIRVTAGLEAGFVRVTVADNGPGMPEEIARHALRRQVKSTKPNGSGIGLTIVRYLVQLQQGEITLTSSPGNGTSFLLRFPAV